MSRMTFRGGKTSGPERLKVCLASWSPFLAGAEIAAERLAVGLREEGHHVLMVIGTEGPVLDRVRDLGIRCVYIPLALTDKWHWWSYRRAQSALRRLWADEKPDVVHSNDLPTHQMVSQAAGRLRIPRICHHRWIFARAAIEWMNKYGAERHLFVSQALRRHLCGESTRLAKSPGEVVYDGLPLLSPPDPNQRDAARRELGLPSDKVIALFAGQVVERKGVADLLHGWMEIPSELRNSAELVIVGDDPHQVDNYRDQMQQLARELNCPARFVGFQSNVWQWLTAADLVVVPSHAEPLGNATLEAMSCALPVIGCDVGGIPEMVVADETGLLVPARSPRHLAAAIARLLGDRSLRIRLGSAGRRRCEQLFDLKHHVERVIQQYRTVLVGQRNSGIPSQPEA